MLPTGTELGDALAFESTFDAGDSYSYGPLADEPVWSTRGQSPAAIEAVAAGPMIEAIRLRWQLRRPRSLTDRCEVELPIALELRLPRGDGDLQLEVTVDHNVEDHRLRLCVATDGAADVAFAGGAFTITRRQRPAAPSRRPADHARSSPSTATVRVPGGDRPRSSGCSV